MNDKFGKVTKEFFEQKILIRLGAKSPSVLVPPRNGVDVGVVKISDEIVMVATTDPLYVVPSYGWEKAAWFAFHILASDLCTSGLLPQYLTVDLNLPPEIKDGEFDAFWNSFSHEAEKYGVSIVTGHTARYQGSNYPMVGGATMIAFGPPDGYITTEMARAGDSIVITKTIALEAASIFSQLFPEYIGGNLGKEILEKGRNLFYSMSTVEDSIICSSFGIGPKGVTSMHDATEGGILGALFEIAYASGNGLLVDSEKIPIYDEVRKICDLFNMDPLISISEGTLVLTVDEKRAEDLVKTLESRNIPATIAGKIMDKSAGIKMKKDGKLLDIGPPGKDDFWKAIDSATSRNLK